MFRLFRKLVILCGVSLFLLLTVIFLDSNENHDFVAKVGVVYGNKVELSGEPSLRLKSRLDAALELYQDDRIQVLFVSGGIGKEGFDEALIMKEYLLSHGVLAENIITDNEGNNTHLTNKNLRLEFGASTSVVAISQKYHISRAKLSLKNSGFTDVYGHAADFWELRDIYSYLRELPAWLKYKVQGL